MLLSFVRAIPSDNKPVVTSEIAVETERRTVEADDSGGVVGGGVLALNPTGEDESGGESGAADLVSVGAGAADGERCFAGDAEADDGGCGAGGDSNFLTSAKTRGVDASPLAGVVVVALDSTDDAGGRVAEAGVAVTPVAVVEVTAALPALPAPDAPPAAGSAKAVLGADGVGCGVVVRCTKTAAKNFSICCRTLIFDSFEPGLMSGSSSSISGRRRCNISAENSTFDGETSFNIARTNRIPIC